MVFRTLFTATLFFLLIVAGFQTSGHAEDWSIRKINPFSNRNSTSKKETSNDLKPQTKEVAQIESSDDEADEQTRPLTVLEIKKSFARIGQETVAAFYRTREALTPELTLPKWEPLRIKFPRLAPATSPEKVASEKAVALEN